MEAVKTHHATLSVRKQCELLMIPRSSLYYTPVGEKPENVKMMNLMDKHLTLHPAEGVRSMVDWLRKKGCSWPQTDPPFVPTDGTSNHLSQEEPHKRRVKSVYKTLSAARPSDYRSQSSMVY